MILFLKIFNGRHIEGIYGKNWSIHNSSATTRVIIGRDSQGLHASHMPIF
jgi:hypothetical protein